MKNKLTCACLLLGGMLLTASCEDTDALKNDINSLEERVEALENQVALFNENIASLHTLLQEGVIISSYTHDATQGTYTLTLSDGTVLTLAEKTADFGNTPLISVDANNNWQVSYDNGTTFTPVTDANGNPVQALGEDGITPMFRINAGYWEISYDNGATYAQVLDEGGNPVQATYDASGSAQVFTSVTVDADSMTLTLADGTTTVEIPIVPDFYCYFDEAITGEQTIQPGATATFNVHMNGAESTVVTAPTGWTATLADDANTTDDIYVLTVTAPQGTLASTKAVADNTRDVSILALKGGFATLTKITVTPISVTIGGGDEPTDPEPETPTTVSLLDLSTEINASMSFKAIGSYQDDKTNDAADYWFYRQDVNAAYDATEQAIKTECSTRGSWQNLSFGYHLGTQGVNQTSYTLTFEFKSSVAANALFGIGLRSSDGMKGFRIADKNGGLRNLYTHSITDEQVNTWQTVSLQFDMTQVSTTTNVNNNTFTAAGAEDVEGGITIVFFNNGNPANLGTYTTFVRNIKLQEVQ